MSFQSFCVASYRLIFERVRKMGYSNLLIQEEKLEKTWPFTHLKWPKWYIYLIIQCTFYSHATQSTLTSTKRPRRVWRRDATAPFAHSAKSSSQADFIKSQDLSFTLLFLLFLYFHFRNLPKLHISTSKKPLPFVYNWILHFAALSNDKRSDSPLIFIKTGEFAIHKTPREPAE